MQSEESCRYCDETVQTEAGLTRHLSDEHSYDELGRIDQRRVTHHSHQPSSRIRQAVGDRPISRRATIAAAIGITGLGGFTLSVLGSSHTEINSWEDLHNIRDNLGDAYTLMTDLDSSSPAYDTYAGPSADGGDGWDPIATFTGTFDGNDHTISDLVVDRVTDDVGLFGRVGAAGELTNIALEDVDIEGGQRTGGLIGLLNPGDVTDSSVTGQVTGTNKDDVGGLVGESFGTITESHTDVRVDGGSENNIGGLVGTNNDDDALISRSYATGDVEGTGSNIGGLVGANWDGGTIEDSFATGAVVSNGRAGGLVGRSRSSSITDTFAIGTVTGDSEVGGLVGYNNDGGSGGASITTSYSVGDVTGSSDVGGLVGRNDASTVDSSYWDDEAATVTEGGSEEDNHSDGGTPLSTDQMQGTAAATNMTGFDFDADWHLVVADERINPIPDADGYPILQAIDTETQLDVLGISWSISSVNININNSTFENNSVGISIGDDE